MFDEQIDKNYIIHLEGSSEGAQRKYFKENYWYKEDKAGHEGQVEFLVSNFLTFTSLDKEEYILYENGSINKKAGCRSKNFLNDGESFVTLYRLYYSEFGKNLASVSAHMPTMDERIEHTIQFIKDLAGIDITDYLRKTFTLDMITLNEDRHFNNLGLLEKDSHFRQVPIFDNGNSLLTTNVSVNWHFPVEDNVKRVIARPFSGSHEKMFTYFGKGFDVDWDNFISWLHTQEDSKEKEVFLYQANFYKKKWKEL